MKECIKGKGKRKAEGKGREKKEVGDKGRKDSAPGNVQSYLGSPRPDHPYVGFPARWPQAYVAESDLGFLILLSLTLVLGFQACTTLSCVYGAGEQT